MPHASYYRQVLSLHLLALLLTLLPTAGLLADEDMGKQLYSHCKTCHGAQGLGGEGGKYPRIAGLPQAYIERQLSNFKDRKRLNKPRIPLFKNWRFKQYAIAAVAGYVSALPWRGQGVSAYEPTPELLAQFDSRAQFLEVGEDIFQDCIQCHGEDGQGKPDKESPPLVNQYPAYIRKQIGDFARGQRNHENSESLFAELEADEVEALVAYISKLGTQ